MKLSEMKQAVELLSKEWDLGKVSAKAKGNVCAWIYLLEILEETETREYRKSCVNRKAFRYDKIRKGRF